MRNRGTRLGTYGLVVSLVALLAACGGSGTSGGATASAGCGTTSCRLTDAVNGLAATAGGPPGVIVVVQHGTSSQTVSAGAADLDTGAPLEATDAMRLASVAKAFSGAAALALVGQGRLSLDDTVGKWLPTLPATWSGITLRQLLDHTSRIPDFSRQKAFAQALTANLQQPPPPVDCCPRWRGCRCRRSRGTATRTRTPTTSSWA